MKRCQSSAIFLVLLSGLVIGIASADLTQSQAPVTGKVFVSGTTFDPGVFFTGDKGTVTYVVTNSNTNTSVMLNHGTFSDADFQLLSGTYDYSNTLGPLQTRPFSFSIIANAPPGDYYPVFSLSFYDSNLYHPSLVRIDNTPIQLTVIDKPDAFAPGKKKTLYLQVANPRDNTVDTAMLEVSGAGITANPSKVFIGEVAAGAKIPVNVSITPDEETTLHLLLTYNNGNNPHETSLDLPITFGIDKKQADPVMSNIQVTSTGATVHVTGDVTNAGLETANAVMVTALPPAVPEDPYKTYVVQALKPDDFGSFEITFSTNGIATSIPVQVSFKDSDGNVYTSVQNVTVPGGMTAAVKSNGPPVVPIAAALVIVAIFVGGWFLYLRKKKQ